ncbi:MAG: DUF3810 domain-containing protein [Defluviitaleaceae bacterium]|nr:DUF3810 domain-containing protein [Defluviitaleaceae bacterium]
MKSFISRITQKNKFNKVFSIICVLISAFFFTASRFIDGFANWHVRFITPLLTNTLGRLISLFPFSVLEILIYSAILFVVFGIGYIAHCLVKKTIGKISSLLWSTSSIICGLFLMMTLTVFVNFSRDSIAEVLSIEIEMFTHNELIALTELLIERTNKIAQEVYRDKDRHDPIIMREIIDDSIVAMQNLGYKYSGFSGFYSRPKTFFFSRGMSHLGITGIFSPFTLEPNFSNDVEDYIIPFVMIHELAHSRGFMREDDANFIAYLAAKNSENAFIRLSGEMNILAYALRAVRRTGDSESYNRLRSSIDERVLAEFRRNAEHWRRFDTPVARVATAANDLYLRVNAQRDGVQSYGRVIDLVFAIYRDILVYSQNSSRKTQNFFR